MRHIIRFIALCFATVPLVSFATDPVRFLENGEATSVPRYLELASEQSISTIHFPAGLYSLDQVEEDGYYYRALHRVVRHSFAGFDQEKGGIFVSESSRQMCGYIVWAGGRTKIGDLSRAPISFRDARETTTR